MGDVTQRTSPPSCVRRAGAITREFASFTRFGDATLLNPPALVVKFASFLSGQIQDEALNGGDDMWEAALSSNPVAEKTPPTGNPTPEFEVSAVSAEQEEEIVSNDQESEHLFLNGPSAHRRPTSRLNQTMKSDKYGK
ncbi:hypothetical protein LA080_013778 [Diaporthe eres]|nr:hypothetical protein LA080_013778 [Diaporthe eres]